MSQVIYKYQLSITSSSQDVQMFEGAKVLSCQLQGGIICLWALVNTSKPLIYKTFKIYATGEHFEPIGFTALNHIGTVQDGPYVWHVFERY